MTLQKIRRIFIVVVLTPIVVMVGGFVIFIFSTEPRPEFDQSSCQYWSSIFTSLPLQETDGGYATRNFLADEVEFRPLKKWTIADKTTIWKNVTTGTMVLDGDFFSQVTGVYVTGQRNITAVTVATIRSPDLNNEQLRDLAIFFLESSIIQTYTDAENGADICLVSEEATDTLYQANFSSIDTIFMNAEVHELRDFSITMNKQTGAVTLTTTDKGSYIRSKFDLFGLRRYWMK